MTKDKIDNLRAKIDNLDDKILSLLDERSQIVNEIGKFKDKSRGVIDTSREQLVLDRLLKNLKGYYSKDSIVRIWRELFHASLQLQVSTDSEILAKRGIENIQIYTGGKSIVEGQSDVIKLSSNENALEPSANVYKIVQKENSLHRYGEISGQSLRA